jgi:hypothetical protein
MAMVEWSNRDVWIQDTKDVSQNELDEIYAFAVDLGRKAGKLLMDRVDQRISDATSTSAR